MASRTSTAPGQGCLFWITGACPCQTELEEGCRWHPSFVEGDRSPAEVRTTQHEFQEADHVLPEPSARQTMAEVAVDEFDEAADVATPTDTFLPFVVVGISP